MRVRLLLIAAFLCALPLAARPLAVRPAPEWVERVDVDLKSSIARENVRWGIYDLFSDHQVRAAGATSHYFRTVRQVLSTSGVQNASELSIDFDPTYERLTIHDIEIVRGGERFDAYEPDEVRVIDKEDSAEQRIYDGEKRALIFLRDVRPGDVIDYSYSLDGANPLLNGRYVDEFDLSSSVPARRMRHRLLWPLGRPLHWRGADPSIITNGNEQTYVWEARDVPALDIEDSVPSWLEPWQAVQVSEFASWNEVAVWAEAMFRLDERSTIEVKKLAAQFASGATTPEARATNAIRFVQDEIRYLGIELGRNSHEPHQPWETLAQRWGDCKDKTLLLVALLRELGYAAWPALVNTRLEHRLAEKIPSPFLFDHVIAQVVIGNRVYWIDGTVSDQGGTLTTIETPADGRALVVRKETTALTPIVVNTKGATLIEQTYTTTDYAKPTLLEVRTTYSGGDADAMRSALATFTIDDLAKERINDLATDQPKIESAAVPKVSDDRAKNVIVVVEKYRIPELWKEREWSWYPRSLESHLRRPDTMIRTMPLAFDYPLDITQTVTFNLPTDMAVEKSTAVTETATFRYEYVVDSNGKTVFIRQSLRARKDFVDAKDVADHLTKLNGIWGEIGYRLTPRGNPRVAAEELQDVVASTPGLLKWVWGLAAVALIVGICLAIVLPRARRRTMMLVPRAMFAPGEAPASALAVGHVDEIEMRLAEMSCRCGASIDSPPDVQRARYADREMTIVTRQCRTCGREQSVYFTAA